MTAETPEIMAADQPEQQTASQTNKRRDSKLEVTTDTLIATAETKEMASVEPVASTTSETVSRGKKRRCDDPDSTAGASPKKTKKETVKPVKARQTKRTKKKYAAQPLPPPVPTPVEVTAPVQAKIDAVKQFIATEMAHEDSMIVRDSSDTNLVSIPDIDFLGVIMALYSHYQLGYADTQASVTDAKEAIKERFKKPVGLYGDADWVTINLATPSKLEKRIKEKIAHHGLECVSLLEVEMELCARRNRVQAEVYQWEAERVVQTGDFLNQLVEIGWDGMRRKIEAELMNGNDGHEQGRRGVCPAPAVWVA